MVRKLGVARSRSRGRDGTAFPLAGHAAFVARLQKVHGRKYGFWGLIEQKGL